MKCPYCNKDMQQGVIKSNHILRWKKTGSLINRSKAHDHAVRLSRGSFVKGESAEAWLCRDCCKVVIDYSILWT